MDFVAIFVALFSLYYIRIEAKLDGQTECLHLTPDITPANWEELAKHDWWVDRMVKLTGQPKGFDKDVNTCSVVSHVEGCEGIHSELIPNPINPNVAKTRVHAYYSVTDDVVVYEGETRQIDEKYPIFEKKLTKMSIIKRGESPVEIELNEFAKEVQNQKFVLVKVGPEGKYLIYRTCNEKKVEAWVQIVASAKNELQGFVEEIMKALWTLMNVTKEDLHDPEEKLPFGLESSSASVAA